MERCVQRYYAVHRISGKARKLAVHLGIMFKKHCRPAYQRLPLPLARVAGSTQRLGTGHYCLTLCRYCCCEFAWSFLKVVNKQSSLDVERCHRLIFNPQSSLSHEGDRKKLQSCTLPGTRERKTQGRLINQSEVSKKPSPEVSLI